MLRFIASMIRRKNVPDQPPKREGYRAIYNLNKEDLLLALAEWVVEHDKNDAIQQPVRRGRIEYLVEKINTIRKHFWTERKPDGPDREGPAAP